MLKVIIDPCAESDKSIGDRIDGASVPDLRVSFT